MVLTEEKRATVADLYREPGKAELVDGKIVRYMATGGWPGEIALNIAFFLLQFARNTGKGWAFGDNVGFVVPRLRSGRESFCPDAAYFDGPRAGNRMEFIQGAPAFAVEVRSEDGYGPTAEKKIAAKRADYFEAGTKVVWDVDSKNECINAYSVSWEGKRTFRRGEFANVEPALPGWRIPVDEIFKTNS